MEIWIDEALTPVRTLEPPTVNEIQTVSQGDINQDNLDLVVAL